MIRITAAAVIVAWVFLSKCIDTIPVLAAYTAVTILIILPGALLAFVVTESDGGVGP